MTLCSILFHRHVLPHVRRHSPSSISLFSPSRKRDVYNVAGPRYHEPVLKCGEYYEWQPEEDGQFYCTGFLREDLVYYRSGGYHPVHLGDTMHGGRYKIVQKLGWGRDATVWLAEDRGSSQHVAVKICTSERRHDEAEARILKKLTEGPTSHPGKGSIVQLLDHFELKGPNGRHRCLVLEVLGTRIEPSERLFKEAWEIARQLVQVIAYCHDLGIVHGDLHQYKIFFRNANVLHCDDDLLKPPKKPKIGNVRPVDQSGNVESIFEQVSTARVPRYLVKWPHEYPASEMYDPGDDLQVKIIGFGERFLAGKMHGAKFRFNYQAPELLLDSLLSPSADIWSLGCLIYYLVSGGGLYQHGWDTKDDIIDEWCYTFGDLPKEWRHHCPPRSDESPQRKKWNVLHQLHSIVISAEPGKKEKWLSTADLESLADLLNSMMQYRPSDRPSATEVLEHPWFKQCPSLVETPGPAQQETLDQWVRDGWQIGPFPEPTIK